MPLQSELLRDDPRLQACLVDHASHLMIGTVGSHVGRVQIALLIIDGLASDRDEIKAQRYGNSTADAVLSFKTKRQIINFSYQSKPDNIVGKMTIAALDAELLKRERALVRHPDFCADGGSHPAHSDTSGKASPGCRLTYGGTESNISQCGARIRSLGVLMETVLIEEKGGVLPLGTIVPDSTFTVFVLTILEVRRVETSQGTSVPKRKVKLRVGRIS